jgi:hypothetical protein
MAPACSHHDPALRRWEPLPAALAELPRWGMDFPQASSCLEPDTTLTWKLHLRQLRPDNKPLVEPEPDQRPTYVVAALPVRKGEPVALQLDTGKGAPVLAVTDRARHAFDPAGSPGDKAVFPGHPVAFAAGEAGKVSLAFTPAHDALWQVWAWVMPEPLAPLDMTSGEHGLSPELAALAALDEGADFDRAWRLARNRDRRDDKVEVRLRRGLANPDAAPARDLMLAWTTALVGQGAPALVQRQTWLARVDQHQAAAAAGTALGRHWAGQRRALPAPLADSHAGARLLAWNAHPQVLGILRQRSGQRARINDPALAKEILLSSLSKDSPANTFLAQELDRLLPKVAGLDAAIYDASGLLVAATNAFALDDLSEQQTWKALTAPGIPRVSSAFARRGLGFSTRVVAVPIGTPEAETLGWLLVEAYATFTASP